MARLIRPLAFSIPALALFGLLLASATSFPTPATPQTAEPTERYVLRGREGAVFNLAGEVVLRPGDGPQIVVEVRRGGLDAEALGVEMGPVAGRETLRVLYPAERVVYSAGGWRGAVWVRVRRDGTWGRGESGLFGLGTRRVRISDKGSGLQAHADLSIALPPAGALDLYLGVGRIRAENLEGKISLDTRSGPVEAVRVMGALTVATGSGSVAVTDAQGEVLVNTGSGSVRVEGFRGPRLRLDTGSGAVLISQVEADRVRVDTGSGSVRGQVVTAADLEVDTGSGEIELLHAGLRRARLDTGSGRVTLHLLDGPEHLVVETGSGPVTLRLPETSGAQVRLESGSGGVTSEIPMTVFRSQRGFLGGQMGDGRGFIRVHTGSGKVRLSKG